MEKKRILIVDDETELARIMAEMLCGCGYLAETAASADEAYDMLGRKSYHLVILDINLPDSTGFEICAELRRMSGIPVIFASARTADDDRVKGLEIGGDDYLPKPYSMKVLLAHVKPRTPGTHTHCCQSLAARCLSQTRRNLPPRRRPG